MLKILGKAASINVHKVIWTCDELNLPFEREDWGAGFRATDDPAFLRLNPNAMVPVLIDDELVLWESNTICRYLCAKTGRDDLLPSHPRARAEVEKWMDWQMGDLNNSWRYAFMSLVRNSPSHQDPAQLAAGIAGWNRMMGVLEQQLQQTGSHVCGEQFTLADIVLGLSVKRWLKAPMQRPGYPAIAAYGARLAGKTAAFNG
ncbi:MULTISPECIES: glutathione S-transferase family protein [unclassified Janthinobacterium]|uniref:glutathione S-transferase family protein n=1 Tax=unclassified Janthinobacterium TaxID=2610881 RepID=UPI00161816B9|nr:MULTISPECIES: glutathione S-transferase [unclassified Janthinobacterium]MBB5370934.1 glutathione S-transferase [Janthinobacterium sp. K2C7]MBB5383740.1 glutathione S-transferase [Janthinobacterium sp. K2Li3]MBB5388245.1 glutathione S-transferase [Janthinobacterium sp. K2E3]